MKQSMKVFVFFAAFVLLLAPHVHGQQMKLEIRNGRVSLDAQNVPVRQILAEWARVGGAKVVNGEKVAGAPVTLQFNELPERQALDIILRSVSGYMLAVRQPGSVGASAFDRILILPTSAGPRSNAPATAAANPFNQPGMIGQPGVPPQMPQGEGGAGQPPVTSTPGNPFGIPAGSSGTPGAVTPVPQPQQRPPQ